MKAAYVVDAVRSPIGRYGGALASVRPDDLLAAVLSALTRRQPRVPLTDIDDVIAGCANQAGEDNRNVARMALLLAGLPETVPGQTVNRLCASSLAALAIASQAIKAGEGDVFLVGGVESMSRAPFVSPKPSVAYPRGDMTMVDTTLGWRFINPALGDRFPPESMAETAENVAQHYQISRERQDAFALRSQRRTGAAKASLRFASELIPVIVKERKGERQVVEDEHPRQDTTLDKLTRLRPITRPDGTVTAGNASGINDGAAALLVVSEDALARYQLKPLARVVATAAAGVSPRMMGIGPVPATRIALRRAGLSVDALELIELNEAFAAQALACIDLLALDEDRVNVNGGAIALGHPLGCSGARIVTTLLHELEKRGGRYGLATMCIGVGQGMAAVFERVF